MYDAHFHMSIPLFDEMKKKGINGIASSCFPEEFHSLKKMQEEYSFLISYGIHPWYAAHLDVEKVKPYLDQVNFIGEIGLDNVWCNTDLNCQKEVFDAQLRYAMDTHKPVILHVKGMEKEVLTFLRKYPNRYLVHWYSCFEYLQEYIDLGCYFTIGPSVDSDSAVQNVAQNIPLDRMLIESDGIGAVAWAKNCDEIEVDYIDALRDSLRKIASIRGVDEKFLETQLDLNFRKFIGC